MIHFSSSRIHILTNLTVKPLPHLEAYSEGNGSSKTFAKVVNGFFCKLFLQKAPC